MQPLYERRASKNMEREVAAVLLNLFVVVPRSAGTLWASRPTNAGCCWSKVPLAPCIVQCLTDHYTSTTCPAYLTHAGFDKLGADTTKAMDAFRLHSDSIIK